MNKTTISLASIAGFLASLGGGIVWMEAIGAIDEIFLHWSLVALLGIALTYGVSWSVTQVRKRLHIPKPWSTPAAKRRIERNAIGWAVAPATSYAAGIALTQPVPIWFWLVAPWVVIFLSTSSPRLWRVVFDWLPGLVRVQNGERE